MDMKFLLRVFGMVCLHGKPNIILHGGCVLSCYGYVLPLDLLDGGLMSFTGLAWLCLVGREYGGVFGSVLAVETVDRVVDKMGMDGTGYYHQMKEKRR